ncbi:MAG TPA: CaiB/BaiF CoA-transferase family protein, partial [Roseiarcus sp.]|nr:CaiB/BaiF CoA-transferase family protein [Roseiarcus sp.]
AGYDFLIQGMGGIMDLTGDPDGEPQKPGVAYADIMSGLYSVIAIEAALVRRSVTGEGGYIDMALMDTQIAVLANQALNYLVSGESPRRLGNAHQNLVPYQVFRVADGHIIIASGNDRQMRDLCRVLGVEALADDPRFRSNADRIANRKILIGLLEERTRAFRSADLLAALEKAVVPAGPINSVADAFADPQVKARGMRINLQAKDAAAGVLPNVRSPILIDGDKMIPERAAPALGEDSDRILVGLGLSESEIAKLRRDGVVA